MKRAGISTIQPGIEALSTRLLKRMRKGVSAYQNLMLLRYARAAGVEMTWNLLWGFPGDEPEAYEETLALLPLIHHLEPPSVVGQLSIDRFSPYFFEPDAHGVRNVRPLAAYGDVFPEGTALAKVAYHFVADFPSGGYDRIDTIHAPTGWHEDETFWDAVSPFIFPPGSFVDEERTAAQILALAGVERGAVLDLCCGPGRHSIPLALRGLAVTGVDRSPVLLRQAQENAEEKGVQIELVRSDMRRFVRPAAFDLALNVSISFGYFEDPGENLAVLANVQESLRPGGVFVLEVSGKEVEARRFHNTGS